MVKTRGKKAAAPAAPEPEAGGEPATGGETQPPVQPAMVKLYKTQDDYGRDIWTRDEPPYLSAPAGDDVTRQAPLVARYEPWFDGPRNARLDSLVVQSNGVKELLHNVFADYPGVNTHVTRLEFKYPFHPFVHRWGRLSTARNNLDPSTIIRQEMDLLYDTLYEMIGDNVDRLGGLQQNKYTDYNFLWAIFQPGDNIYDPGDNPLQLLAGHDRVAQIRSTHYHDNRFICRVRYVEFDGKQFGSVYTDRPIAWFDGIYPITALSIYPLRYHPQEAAVRHRLIQRGRRWEEEYARDMFNRHKKYNGHAIASLGGRDRLVDINSRVMIDAYACVLANGGLLRTLVPPMYDQLGDNERLLAGSSIAAYSLNDHNWVSLEPDKLRNIAWDTTAFDSLVFPPGQQSQKELVLFAAREYYEQSQESLISNRDAALIIRLSGPSGSGKTFTVESVSENMKAPLFVLKADELGDTVQEAERTLRAIIPLVVKWKGVLLLKDADVFLGVQRTPVVEEERNNHRNERVSMFLEMVESCKVIIFLTTKHDNGIDPTLDSHVDLWIRYNVTPGMRRRLWDLFLGSDRITQQNPRLSDAPLNGRQIKAAATMALRLAEMNQGAVTYDHVKTVLSLGLNDNA